MDDSKNHSDEKSDRAHTKSDEIVAEDEGQQRAIASPASSPVAVHLSMF